MFCSKCGNKLPDEAWFCNKCGHPVSEVEAEDTVQMSDDVQAHYQQTPSTEATLNLSKEPQFQQNLPPSYVRPEPSRIAYAESQYEKVPHPYHNLGGWLGCIAYFQLIGTGLLALLCIIQFISILKLISWVDNGVIVLYFIELAGFGLCAYLSIKFFTMIRNRNPEFLRFYEILMIVLFSVYVVFMFMGAVLDLIIASESIPNLISAATSFFIWTTYFRRSVRVRTYFGSDEYLRLSIFFKGSTAPMPADMQPTNPASFSPETQNVGANPFAYNDNTIYTPPINSDTAIEIRVGNLDTDIVNIDKIHNTTNADLLARHAALAGAESAEHIGIIYNRKWEAILNTPDGNERVKRLCRHVLYDICYLYTVKAVRMQVCQSVRQAIEDSGIKHSYPEMIVKQKDVSDESYFEFEFSSGVTVVLMLKSSGNSHLYNQEQSFIQLWIVEFDQEELNMEERQGFEIKTAVLLDTIRGMVSEAVSQLDSDYKVIIR